MEESTLDEIHDEQCDDNSQVEQQNWWIKWTCIYVSNLPLAMFCAFHVLHVLSDTECGFIGMFIGITLMWCVGQAICLCPGILRKALCIGGIVIGFTQLIALPHMFLGRFAIDVTESITAERFSSNTSHGMMEVNGFLATILTAQPLMVLAIVIGLIIECFGRTFPPNRYIPPSAETQSINAEARRDYFSRG